MAALGNIIGIVSFADSLKLWGVLCTSYLTVLPIHDLNIKADSLVREPNRYSLGGLAGKLGAHPSVADEWLEAGSSEHAELPVMVSAMTATRTY